MPRRPRPSPDQSSLFPDDPPPTPVPVTARHPALEAAFDLFWQAYPRKVGKRAAMTAFNAAVVRAGGVDVMLATIAVWRAEWTARPQFCPHPTTWLHRDGWDDAPPMRRVEERHLHQRESSFAAVARRKGVIG